MAGKRKRGAKENGAAAANGHKKAKNDSNSTAKSTTAVFEKRPFVESPAGEERRREATLYDLLANEDENERIFAADCIISSLIGEEKVPEAVLERHLERRLFRGLASGRNAARLGFSLVITELVTQLFGEQALAAAHYPGLTFQKAVRILMDKTQAVGNIPGQEERDHYLGQLFGIECFVSSGVIFAEPTRWNMVLDLLLKIAQKKVWLRSQCGWVVVQALRQMDQASAEATLKQIADANLAKTADGVALWITAMSRYPDIKVKPWRHPLATKTLGDLASVLKESLNESGKDASEKKGNAPKQANWTAQLHFVWDMLLAYYAGEDVKADELDQFWQRVVDDGFFSKNATDGQKFKGFMVFQKMLEGLADQKSKLGKLFSKNLLNCLMNQAAKEDRYLHRAAVKALKAIENTVAAHPKSLTTVLRNLLTGNGVYNFDQRTASKTIDRLLQNSGTISEKRILEVLQLPIPSLASQEEAQAKSTLRSYVEHLSKVLNASASTSSEKSNNRDSFGLYLQELSRLAYSQPEDIPSLLLTEQIRELCRSRLESSLSKLTRNADDFSGLCNAIGAIDPSSVDMEDDIKTAVDDALKRMRSLLKRKTKTEAGKSVNEALATLHAISIFQLYNEDPDAMESLKDLAQYDDKLRKGDKTEGSSELLVEILLSMVARPSSLMRQVSQQVFEAFSSHITAGGLQLLTDPLASNESTKGQKELFNTDDDAMLIDEDVSEDGDDDNVVDLDDASDVELGSDVEFVNLADQEDASDDDSDDSDSDDEDENGDEQEGPIDLDELCATILKSHRLDKDADAASSDSDGDMSDGAMMELDGKLAEVFKQRARARPDSKKDRRDARQSVVQFKHRILDLVDVYARVEGGARRNPLAFALLPPLLNLVRTTATKPLAVRACDVILNYQKALRKARSGSGKAAPVPASAAEQEEDLLPLLTEIHEEAGKDNAHAYSKAASAASLIIAGSMLTADRDSIRRIAAVYAQTQSRWVLGEARLQTSFFVDWNNWCQNHAAQARDKKAGEEEEEEEEEEE
ncbi:DNA polymerase V [Cordyceps fumosorosea ARSEF 2679]|uniref:DNA polymerase V n=1 Tax=Cordyceps fumosorosea (strain ARSEF 2679) TaxID=1081104 RepID=A0A162MVZ0_CORFA|nr:DNA polymerase V [Cordyceps fumosorosea ARSEF 2679]OAA71449.1 DNA polymerase V [Cordyceps fumosorosea ARSEF 2679]